MAHDYSVTIVLNSPKHTASGKRAVTHVFDWAVPLTKETLYALCSQFAVQAFIDQCETLASIKVEKRNDPDAPWREVKQDVLDQMLSHDAMAGKQQSAVTMN